MNFTLAFDVVTSHLATHLASRSGSGVSGANVPARGRLVASYARNTVRFALQPFVTLSVTAIDSPVLMVASANGPWHDGTNARVTGAQPAVPPLVPGGSVAVTAPRARSERPPVVSTRSMMTVTAAQLFMDWFAESSTTTSKSRPSVAGLGKGGAMKVGRAPAVFLGTEMLSATGIGATGGFSSSTKVVVPPGTGTGTPLRCR